MLATPLRVLCVTYPVTLAGYQPAAARLCLLVRFGERAFSYPYPLAEPGGTVTQCAAGARKHQISLLWERPLLPTAVLLSRTNEAVFWAPELRRSVVRSLVDKLATS